MSAMVMDESAQAQDRAEIIRQARLRGVELDARDIRPDGASYVIDGMDWKEWLDALTEG